MLNSFKDLVVWQKSFTLVKQVYEITKHLPQNERFNLIDQAQRSAISISSNIAEGYGRGSKKDYAKFLWIAHGSTLELETQLLLAKDLYNLEIGSAVENLSEVRRMLRSLIAKLNPAP